MRILIVSYWFPPQNTIGAVRVGKFAKFLHLRGHDVRALTALPDDADRSLPLEIPQSHVICADDWNVDALLDPVKRLFQGRGNSGKTPRIAGNNGDGAMADDAPNWRARLRAFLTRHYYALLRIPDSKVGWRSAALVAGRQLLRDWRPDIIVASAPPVTRPELVRSARKTQIVQSLSND